MSLRGAMRLMGRDRNFRTETREILIDVLVEVEIDCKDELQEAAKDLNNAYLSFLAADEEEDKVKRISGNDAYKLFVETYGKVYMKEYDEEYAFSNFIPNTDWTKFHEISASIVREVAETSATHDRAAMRQARKQLQEENEKAA